MKNQTATRPRCIVIAGPNGAGKTTFAREFLPREAGVLHFVNADLIASGLSPLRPELAAQRAGRLVLAEIDRLAKASKDFAFETTLSGRTYLRLLNRWKATGYRIDMVFLWLPSVQLALQRIAARVRQGGITSRELMWSVALIEVGRISRPSIGPWRMPGLCMTIRGKSRDYWRKARKACE